MLRESTRGMTFAADVASLLHLPFVFPLNYLRALRDWPTNPVRLNNLPIIRGPLCFIRRVSNKSHCVFRRAVSNSILWCEPSPRIRRWKKTRRRNGRGSDRRDREGGDRARFARIDSKFGWTSRIYDEAAKETQYLPSYLRNIRDRKSIGNIRD